MTTQRHDNHSTEFGLWLRKQDEIDSSLGFLATNIDYLWRNYKTGQWMFLEEKRHGCEPKPWQWKTFGLADSACRGKPGYLGFHLIVFENTSPDDGKIYLDRKEITKGQLVSFLRFEANNEKTLDNG
jgi:hypothetical protein